MIMFNPKYLYCTWSDSLKGKEVLYGDHIDSLVDEVQNMNTIRGEVIGRSEDNDTPFIVKGVSDFPTNWQYVYYDPDYTAKVAYYKHHKRVQFRNHMTDEWIDCVEPPAWSDLYEYRIKPDEPEERVVQATEFPSLCGYCIHRKDGCIPKSACNCVNFYSTNDDYFRVKKNYVDLVKEHVELERKYGALVSGLQQLMHGPVNC